MQKRITWLIIGLVVGLLFYANKPRLLLTLTKYLSKRQNVAACKQDPHCIADRNGDIDACFTLASAASVGTGREADEKRKTIGCTQKRYLERLCRNEDRCLTSVGASFDECYAAFPNATDPKGLLGCLNERAGTQLFK